jgi:chitinase
MRSVTTRHGSSKRVCKALQSSITAPGKMQKNKFKKTEWANTHRDARYRTAAQSKKAGERYRCEVDEFPMGAWTEGWNNHPQFVRLVNGKANGDQGKDFQQWKYAVWTPCSLYRKAVCGIATPEPPITWDFDLMFMDRHRMNAKTDGSHFIERYGVRLHSRGLI